MSASAAHTPQHHQHHNGLFIKKTREYIPLQSIKISAAIDELVAKSTLTQVFELSSQQGSVEVTYEFPLGDSASVNHFEAIIEQKSKSSDAQWLQVEKIVGRIQRKEDARNAYDDAVVEGKRSVAIVEKKEKSSDEIFVVTFTLRCAPSAAAEDDVDRLRVTVVLSIVHQLSVSIYESIDNTQEQQSHENDANGVVRSLDDLFVRFSLPLALPESFFDEDDNDKNDRFQVDLSFGASSDIIDVKCPHVLVQPAKQLLLRQAPPAGQDFAVYFKTAQFVTSLADSNASVGFSKGTGSGPSSSEKALVELDEKQGSPSYCVTVPIFAPTVLEEVEGTEQINATLFFVVDCSGSMSGSPIRDASNCLKIFLKSLPFDQGIRIQIIRFGSSFEKCFTGASTYSVDVDGVLLDEQSLKKAMDYADALKADLGGTELFKPLQAVLQSRASSANYSKQIFVLTDGEIERTQETLEMVRKGARSSGSIFSLGIGSSVDKKLVQGLADNSGGYAEFIRSGEKMEAKVIGQLNRALKPCLIQGLLNWPQALLSSSPIERAYSVISPMYYGTHHLFSVFVSKIPENPVEIVFKAQTGGSNGNTNFEKRFLLDPATITKGQALHTLAAASMIREMDKYKDHKSFGLDEPKELKEKLVRFALAYKLVSSETSFVAVSEEYASGEAAQTPIKTIRVPTCLASDDDSRSSSPLGHHGLMQALAMRRTNAASPDTDSYSSDASESDNDEEEDDGWSDDEVAVPQPKLKKKVTKAATTMQDQDEMLDNLAAQVNSIKQLAHSIGDELMEQNELLDELDNSVDKAKKEKKQKTGFFSSLLGGKAKTNTAAAPAAPDTPVKKESAAQSSDLLSQIRGGQMLKKVASADVPKKAAPVSASSSTTKSYGKGTLEQLIFAQDPRGYWTWNSSSVVYTQASNTLSADRFSQLEALFSAGNFDDKTFATCVALVLLEKCFAAEKSTWVLIAKKAQLFLKKQQSQQQDQDLLTKIQALF